MAKNLLLSNPALIQHEVDDLETKLTGITSTDVVLDPPDRQVHLSGHKLTGCQCCQ